MLFLPHNLLRCETYHVFPRARDDGTTRAYLGNSDLNDHFSDMDAYDAAVGQLAQLEIEFLEVEPETHLVHAVDLGLHHGGVAVLDLEKAPEQLLPFRWQLAHHL